MTASLAFWLKEKEKKSNACLSEHQGHGCSAELHFNLWALDYKRKCISKRLSYLDIGVRLTIEDKAEFDRFDSVNIYVPFGSEDFIYNDRLAEKICNSDALISAVFNSSLTEKKPSVKQGFTDIQFTKKNERRGIRFYNQLQKDSSGDNGGVKIEKGHGLANSKGSIVSIPFEHFTFDKDLDIYVRFRLELHPKAMFAIAYRYRPWIRTVVNDHEVTEIVDFRLNEVRNLPGSVTKHLQNTDYLKKIHFFLIRDSLSEYKMSESPYKRCRILEPELWDDYINLEKSNRKKILQNPMLIYHWIEKGEEIKNKKDEAEKVKRLGIDHFSAFSKFISKPVRWPEMIAVVLISVLIGVASGLMSNSFWTN